MSETMTQPTPTLLQLPASELADHPILAHIPVWARAEPEFEALLASIAERGLDYPVLIDSRQQVVDGRNRRNALRVLGRTVTCRVVADAEAAQIAVASLANRRHLPKGALAYLVAPLLKPAVDEIRERQMANIKAGTARASTESTLGKTGTVEDLARSLGFSRDLLFQALDLHKRFEGRDDLRAQFEPHIIAGDYGLGAAIQAIAGKVSTEGKEKKTAAPDVLLTRVLKTLHTRFKSWGTLDEDRRATVTATVTTSTAEWPDDVVAATAAAWRKAGRIV